MKSPCDTEISGKCKSFAKIEMFNSAMGAFIGGVFLAWHLFWSNNGDGPLSLWLLGVPPLIYFIIDFGISLFLLLGLQKEPCPTKCYSWINHQILNLILFTFLGLYMNWEYCLGTIYLKLTVAFLIMYGYKAYAISLMYHLIQEMKEEYTPLHMCTSTMEQSKSKQLSSDILYNIV